MFYFIFFTLISFFLYSEHFRSGPRPRAKEDEEAAEKLNTGTIDNRQENGVDQLEHCPNVCTHNSAPTPANTNHLYENSNTNALWVRASTKSVRNRVARKFYSMLYFCGCGKHEHDTDYKETYTACIDNPVDDDLFKRIPDVDYSDRPTISNESSVDIDLTETSKKLKVTRTGSDSAISIQNDSSNDSRRTNESYTSAGHITNYSRPDKRLKKYGNSFDKQRSFDSYAITECDGNENENDVRIVQLEHVSAKLGKSSPKSTLSHESRDLNVNKRFGREIEDSDDDSEIQNCFGLEGGSGLFSVNQNESDRDESLVDEMNNYSRLLFSKRQNSEDMKSNGIELTCFQEQKPLLDTKPKLLRQSKVVQADVEDVPNEQTKLLVDLDENTEIHNSYEQVKQLSDLEENTERDVSKEQINLVDENSGSLDIENDLGHFNINENVNNGQEEVNISKNSNKDKHRSESPSNDVDLENSLSEEGRADSWETFKDLVHKKCYNGRNKNKSSRTTTV